MTPVSQFYGSVPHVCICLTVRESSLVFFSCFQDFLIMFVHHLATIGLITFSYVNNMVRVGTLVLCLHDASDFLLEVSFLPDLHVPGARGGSGEQHTDFPVLDKWH